MHHIILFVNVDCARSISVTSGYAWLGREWNCELCVDSETVRHGCQRQTSFSEDVTLVDCAHLHHYLHARCKYRRWCRCLWLCGFLYCDVNQVLGKFCLLDSSKEQTKTWNIQLFTHRDTVTWNIQLFTYRDTVTWNIQLFTYRDTATSKCFLSLQLRGWLDSWVFLCNIHSAKTTIKISRASVKGYYHLLISYNAEATVTKKLLCLVVWGSSSLGQRLPSLVDAS